jgi:hypothetical protein
MYLEQNFWEICKNDANRPVMRFIRIISETIRRQFKIFKESDNRAKKILKDMKMNEMRRNNDA